MADEEMTFTRLYAMRNPLKPGDFVIRGETPQGKGHVIFTSGGFNLEESEMLPVLAAMGLKLES